MTDSTLLGRWTVERGDTTSPDGQALLFRYMEEVARRYNKRPMSDEEIDALLVEMPSDDLTVFLIARFDGVPAGCVGIRPYTPEIAELKRMFVDPHARGTGGSGLLLRTAEGAARELGAKSIWLNTRDDLVEARALYAKHGYQAIPEYGDDPYGEHWLGKDL